ncbi:MAG: ABC transporter substrate-binding protein [bacterium]|nr:ABC transporter substrate-binding protein [bacterium]
MKRLFLFIGLGLFLLNTLYAERIITLSPALTEMVFALEKGDAIVGNTTFCNYPEKAKTITRIGGYYDTNRELLVKLEPDVIFLYPEYHEKIKFMEKRATLVTIEHSCLEDIFSGITAVAKVLKVEAKGQALVDTIKNRLEAVRKKTSGEKRQKVLMVIGRTPDKLSNMYIVGKGDFLIDLLHMAGGENAYTGDIRYPSISMESIMQMNPDVILELSAFNEGIEDAKVLNLWNKFPFVRAVKNKKIKIVKNAFWVIPGPRVARIAEEMYKMLHP